MLDEERLLLDLDEWDRTERWENNIKMNIKDKRYKCVNFVQGVVQMRVTMKTVK
jgi:hypothetical protein